MNEYISIKVILDRILRHPLMLELQFETAVQYTIDFMRIVGMPKMFEQKVSTIMISNYRADLSDLNIYKIICVKQGDIYFQYSGNDFMIIDQSENNDIIEESDVLKKNGFDYKPIIKDTAEYYEIQDSFKYNGLFEIKNNMNTYYSSLNSTKPYYKIQGNMIYTSIKDGNIEIAYLTIPIIDDYPAVLDNSSYLRALEAYIKKQWFTVLFDMGKIQGPVLQNIQQEYAWAVGDCESEFNRMTLDQAEYFYNSMKNILNDNHHLYGFKYLGG